MLLSQVWRGVRPPFRKYGLKTSHTAFFALSVRLGRYADIVKGNTERF